ncbi:MAG: hypothetical protein ACI93T_000849 [Porticoccaceae bacterium]|jgi:hypothetical protein
MRTEPASPSTIRLGTGQLLHVKLAARVTVKTTLSQRHIRIQNPTVDVCFHFTDGRVNRGQILIRATVFSENRQVAFPDFNVVAVTRQLLLKLDHPVANRTFRSHSAILTYKFVLNVPQNRTSGSLVLNPMNRPPQYQREIAVVFAEMPQALVTDSKDVMRTASSSPNDFVNHQPLSFQPPQTLSNRRCRYASSFADLLNRPSAHAVNLFKKVLIIWIDRESHANISENRTRAGNRETTQSSQIVEAVGIIHNQN